MGAYTSKFATAEQIAEINKLYDEGHAEALTAFGLDCANACKEGLLRRFWIAAGIGAALGVVSGVVEKVIKKRRANKKLKECLEELNKGYIPEEES